MESSKVLEVEWASNQGKKALIARFKNSPVMHKNIPSECKPMLFENGVPVLLTASRSIERLPRFKSHGQRRGHLPGRLSVDSHVSCQDSSGPVADVADNTESCGDGSEKGNGIVQNVVCDAESCESCSDCSEKENAILLDVSTQKIGAIEYMPRTFLQRVFAFPNTEQLFEVKNTFIVVKEQPATKSRTRARSCSFSP